MDFVLYWTIFFIAGMFGAAIIGAVSVIENRIHLAKKRLEETTND